MTRLFLLLVPALALLASCSTPEEIPEETLPLKPGTWRMNMSVDSTFIPLRFEVDSAQHIYIVNCEERIEISQVSIDSDSITFSMPRFSSSFHGTLESSSRFEGYWVNLEKDDYRIPFEAFYTSQEPAASTLESNPDKYEVWFSPNTEDEYKAIGLFTSDNGELHGTFITETGDYRYLQGSLSATKLNLSCFDGSHLFSFTGNVNGDSITNGLFRSGKHWEEPWVAIRNNDYQLTHPDSLTYIVDNEIPFSVDVMDMRGDLMTFNDESLRGEVTIVQIFGSWCPNCYDENVFYKELYETYHDFGFNIVPIAFEKSDDFAANVMAIEKQFAEIGISYPPYIGGKASKSVASQKFPMLNKIISFPTSIFLDKAGNVRKVHTGFYGPGTGTYYETYMRDTKRFIEMLLAESHEES